MEMEITGNAIGSVGVGWSIISQLKNHHSQDNGIRDIIENGLGLEH
jgi:hypothetical protein